MDNVPDYVVSGAAESICFTVYLWARGRFSGKMTGKTEITVFFKFQKFYNKKYF